PLPCRLELGMPPGVALTVRVAVRSPSADGVNCTLTVQVSFLASIRPLQPSELMAKSPGGAIETDTAPETTSPALVSWKEASALGTPTTTPPKSCDSGKSVRLAGASDAPESAAMAVPPGLPLTVSEAARRPAA